MIEKGARKIIPIVFATNKNYYPYLGVSINSLICHATEEYQYEIYILHTTLSAYEQEKIQRFARDNINISCVNILEYTKHMNLYSSLHLSEETVYRILIPDVLPQYNKIIYLDCDLVVLRNIADFYSYNLHGYVMGVIRDVPFDDITKHVHDDLELSDKNCFNAGVLLMDTELFREKQIKNTCLNLLSQDRLREKRRYIYMDQDVLNIACQGMTTFLDPEWNFQWQYLQPDRCERIDTAYRSEYLRVSENPYILHYAGEIKPWHEPGREMADIFWEYARNTVFYEQIIYENAKNRRRDCFKVYMFPFSKIEASSKISLYGAGRVGEAFYNQLEQTEYCKVLLWADKNHEKLKGNNPLIASPDNIISLPYDYVVIAIENERIAASIKRDLMEMGVNAKKLVWASPKK